ncbi:MAG: hypothetical protein SO132_02445 [Candidatus Enteromonas sp.]|nr:hypothetical protein [Mollicutes bacterium]MDY4935617.1 hypothetical protein [Candidatus Enteromonas sp.]
MKKYNKIALLTLSSLSIITLAGCNDGTSEEDKTIESIKIVEGSIASSFYLDSTPDYSNLKVKTLNKSNEEIETIKVSEKTSYFTYTEIDTSTLAKGKVFTVTYKVDDRSFEDSITYDVIDHEYEIVSWSQNASYSHSVETSFTNSKLSSSEENLESGFLENRLYYIGNQNEANLLPQINALDENNTPMVINFLPAGVSMSIKEDGKEAELDASKYIENAGSFLKNGLLKFKSDVTGSFVITLKVDSNPALKPIEYKVNVVNAYNATKGIDLYALANCKASYYPYYDSTFNNDLKEFKEKNSIPETTAIVFQNDITFNKSDLISSYFWGDDAVSSNVKGSFKDWIHIVDHTFDKEESVVIYGNSHHLALNDNKKDPDCFPDILTESSTGTAQDAGEPISSHSTLFYGSFAEGVDPAKCNFDIQDLEVSGNLGVSAESTIKVGGPMFMKTEVTSSFNNVNVSKFYMALMAVGNETVGNSTYDVQPTLNVNSCRFRDTFNASIYCYAGGTINITNSELVNAGGPLLFLNPRTEDFSAYISDISKLGKAEVNIDNKSFLSNKSEGKGGWFDAYSATTLAGQLINLDQLFATIGMSFLRKDNNVSKFNFLMVNLPINEEGITLPYNKGGVNVTVRKGDNIVYSTVDGYADVYAKAAGFAGATTPEQQYLKGRELCSALGNTFFGNNYAFSNQASMAFFAATNEKGEREFACPAVDATGQITGLQRTEYAILGAKGLANATDSPTPTDIMKNEGYLAATLIQNNSASSLVDLTAYKGACNYGVLFGDYHKI